MKNKTLLKRGLLVLMLLVTLACDAVASLMPDGATPTPGPPAETETPPPEPLPPFPAPELLFREPEPREPHALDAPVELVFDQPMDRKSVADAFTIEPAVRGELSWVDARTLRFVPAQGFDRATRYAVTVREAARNVEGTALVEPLRFDFETVGYVAVSEVQPLPGSTFIEPDTAITVIFNRPIVPLTAISDQDGLPQPLRFDPPVDGKGEWLNTAIYRFHSENGLRPATSYTARVEAGLQDNQGAVLQQDYSWTFTTVPPTALSWSPISNAEHVGPGEVISVTFNQPMDHASTEDAFQLRIGNRTVAGDVRWSGGEDALDTETMVFTPDQPLPRNADGFVEISTSARSREGEGNLPADISWTFETVRNPGIISIWPADGAAEVDPYSDVEIIFASPMQRDALLDHLTILPDPTDVYTYWAQSDTELRLAFPKEPATSYEIQLDAAYPDKYGEALNAPLTLRFTTGDLSAYAGLSTLGDVGTFDAYTDTVLYARHRNVSRLDVALYELSLNTFMRLHGYGTYDYRQDFRPAQANLLRQWSVPVEAPLNTAYLTRLDLVDAQDDQLPPGIYYVELSAPEVLARDPETEPATYTVIRSRVNLVLKQSNAESLAWATDLATGEPLSDQPIRFYHGRGVEHGAGSTDGDGLWITESPDEGDLWDDYFAVLGDPGDANFALAHNDWDNGIRPWNFDLTGDYGSGDYVGYLYTDRPIYRPGQIVYFKGIVRADEDADYTVPAEMDVLDVRISDPQGEVLYDEPLLVSEMGTFFGELELGPEAPLGTYFLQAEGEPWDFYASTSFRLAEYRKPEFEVAIATDREAYVNGDEINVNVAASYYFGGAVANAELTWRVLSAPHAFEYVCPTGEQCPRYSWTDYEWEQDYGRTYAGYGRLIAEGETTTDDQGRATFRIAADISEEIQSRRFTLEATVTDLNNQVVSQRTTAIVHRGNFYVGLAPESRVAQANREQMVSILAVDWESEPVADEDLDVVVMEHRWYSVRVESDNGNAYWTWTTEDIPIYTTTAKTDGDGTASIPFTPESSGSYRVRAIGEDDAGNEIRSSTYLWVWGGGEATWRRESNNRIDLIADRDAYEVGNVAEILIPSPYTGTVQALITIERGKILESEVRELSSTTELLRIHIEEEHVPNVFVSVVLMQGSAEAPDALATFKMGEVVLPVSTASKELSITLTPDKEMGAEEHYRPRETAVYDVLVTDHAGEPVEAELSLRLADLAVLALADETGPTLTERFWRERGLGVRTALPLAVTMEAHNRELAPRAKGGGGGAGDQGLIRTQFADTAYWNPVVTTGADGRARIEVALPDNLTTWRMQARGITDDTLVGRAEVDVRSTLDMLVRPLVPRFFVIGDRAEIATIVHNNTGAAITADVVLTVEGLDVDGPTQQSVDVPAEGQVKVRWPVEALPGDEVVVRMEASADELYDGREDRIPVYHYTTPEVVATAGRLSEPGERQEVIQLPRTFDPDQGELTVQIDGSLTAATQDALRYLEHYPYECVEQTVSRFLPNVLTYQVLAEMGYPRPELERALQEQVGVALQRIYNKQHYDGGWGWWVNDQSNVYLTAYVLHGLLEAHRAEFTVSENVINNAAQYLRENLPSITRSISHWEANRAAYQLYVLGEYQNLIPDAESSGELGRAVQLYNYRDALDRYGQATLAMALGLLAPEEETRINTLLSDLAGDAVHSATGTHWEEAEPDYWNMNTDIRSTAIVLWALARHNPESELLPNAVRWLMGVRKEGYWESTNTTSWSLIALVAYMRASGELAGDYSYVVNLNGEAILEGNVDETTIDESRQIQIEIAQLFADQANRLIIERQPAAGDQSGEGQLYYTAHLRYFLPAREVQALDRGVIVARQYSPVEDPDAYVDEAAVGDTIRVKLTIVAPTDLHYVIVEDPLPAGFEAVDVSLNTTSVVGERPSVRNLSAEEEERWYRWYGWGWWWFSHSEIRDEKVTLFSTYLPRGTYEYSYVMRAGVPGTYNVIPTTAYEMYFPEVFGRSDGGVFTVRGE